MTNAIRARIDQIRQGKVPEGYVRTRAGIMPSDWPTTIKARDVFYSHSVKSNGCGLMVLSATQDRGIVPRSEVDIDIKYDTDNLDSYKKVDVGDFVISLRSFQGGIECSTYEGIVSPAYTVLKNRIAICNGYYREYFKTDDFIARLNGAVYGIRDGKQIGFDDFGDMLIHCPSLQEQERIAKILSTCDRIIDKYEEETEQYRKLKQYLLDKMFPKEGATVPEIRFTGFTDAWEKRMLGELYTERNERGNELLQILSVSIHSGVSDGELDASSLGKVVQRSDDKSTYKHVYKGDLVFNMMRAWQGAIGVVKTEGMISPAYISAIPSDEIYPLFMNYLLRRNDTINQINNFSYGVTDFRKRLYWDSFIRVTCRLPSVKEQQYITSIFEHLDNLITLHQRVTEAWKTKKKALAQLLLTGIVRV